MTHFVCIYICILENSEVASNSNEEKEDTVACNGDPVKFKMVWNKVNYEMVKLGKQNTVSDLRKYIDELTGMCSLQGCKHSQIFLTLHQLILTMSGLINY